MNKCLFAPDKAQNANPPKKWLKKDRRLRHWKAYPMCVTTHQTMSRVQFAVTSRARKFFTSMSVASHITLERTLINCVTFRSFLNFLSCVYFKFYEPFSFLPYRMLQFKGNLCSSYHKGKFNTLFITEPMFSTYSLTHRCFSKIIVTLAIPTFTSLWQKHDKMSLKGGNVSEILVSLVLNLQWARTPQKPVKGKPFVSWQTRKRDSQSHASNGCFLRVGFTSQSFHKLPK